jgi:hypothetical protein
MVSCSSNHQWEIINQIIEATQRWTTSVPPSEQSEYVKNLDLKIQSLNLILKDACFDEYRLIPLAANLTLQIEQLKKIEDFQKTDPKPILKAIEFNARAVFEKCPDAIIACTAKKTLTALATKTVVKGKEKEEKEKASLTEKQIELENKKISSALIQKPYFFNSLDLFNVDRILSAFSEDYWLLCKGTTSLDFYLFRTLENATFSIHPVVCTKGQFFIDEKPYNSIEKFAHETTPNSSFILDGVEDFWSDLPYFFPNSKEEAEKLLAEKENRYLLIKSELSASLTLLIRTNNKFETITIVPQEEGLYMNGSFVTSFKWLETQFMGEKGWRPYSD